MSVKGCEMIGCKMPVVGSIQVGPGTRVSVCETHLKQLNKDLGRGD